MNMVMEVGETLQDVRQELDDHLTAINENTDEIENNYSYLINIEKKLKFLEAKMEQMAAMLAKVVPQVVSEDKPIKLKISEKEQEVFSILYGAVRALDCAQIAARLRKSETFVRYSINAMLSKGIPITKHIISRKTYFLLDPHFKELQCKENILNLSKTLTLDCFDQSIL
jgi:cell division protein ZapA (FtsZ GTPase activity inhibitor)